MEKITTGGLEGSRETTYGGLAEVQAEAGGDLDLGDSRKVVSRDCVLWTSRR